MSGRERTAWIGAGLALAAAFPVVFIAPDARAAAASALALLLAAGGLNIAMGYAGQPSLAQGAFVGAGAYATAALRVHAGAGPVLSILGAVAVAAAAGAVLARAVAHLRPPFVALASWLVAWLFALALPAFPRLTGGAAGLVLPPTVVDLPALGLRWTLGEAAMFEIALVSVALAALGWWAAVRRHGPVLAAVRSDGAAAAAAGIQVARVRTAAHVAAAAAGGWAGGLLVLTAGVADPTAYGPVLSLELFLVVLLGGAATLAGPAAGLAILVAVGAASDAIADAGAATSTQIRPLIAGAALLVVVLVARRGVIGELLAWHRVRGRVDAPAADPTPWPAVAGATLQVRDAAVAFGGVRALDGVSLDVAAGTCHALIGPNGSGKSTLLRVCAGALRPPEVAVLIDGRDVRARPPAQRVADGVARTFQRLAVAPEPTVLEHVMAGMEPHRSIGMLRWLTATPGARAERRAVAAEALALLARVGLAHRADTPCAVLTAGEARAVQLARALASRPRLLLLDEPSAGTDAHEEAHLLEILRATRDAGLTIVLVEHNLALVRAIADRVTVLQEGRILREGTIAQIARDPAVVEAYLGADTH